jgi:hypothetical protein
MLFADRIKELREQKQMAQRQFAASELRVMMQSCGNLSADSDSVAGTSCKDISEPVLKNFLFKRYTEELTNAGIGGHLVQSTEMEDIVKAIDTNFTVRGKAGDSVQKKKVKQKKKNI